MGFGFCTDLERATVEDLRVLLKVKINSLENELLFAMQYPNQTTGAGMDLKKSPALQLSQAYFEYGMITHDEAQPYFIRALQIDPSFKFQSKVTFEVDLPWEIAASLGIDNPITTIVFEKEAAEIQANDINLSSFVYEVMKNEDPKSYGYAFHRLCHNEIDRELGYDTVESGINSSFRFYKRDGEAMHLKNKQLEAIIPPETIKAAKKFHDLNSEEQKSFLLQIHEVVVEKQIGQYFNLRAKHKPTASVLSYYADKMRVHGLNDEANQLDSLILQYVDNTARF